MNRLVRTLAALFLLAAPASAQTVIQAGPWQGGHALTYTPQGGSSIPLVQDAGPAGGGATSSAPGISEYLSVVPPLNGSPAPWANSGTGPLGTNWCDYDAPIANPGGYHYFCLSPNAQGGGLITYGSVGASPLPLQFDVNGVLFPADQIAVGRTAIGNGTNGAGLYDNAGILGDFPLDPGVRAILANPANVAGGLLTGATNFANARPILGGGTGQPLTQGTVSGSTTAFITADGALSNGHCPVIDASGGLIDSGGGCGGGGGGGTVTAYLNHAALISGTTAFGTQTLSQAGFTTAGDGGNANYQWNANSYCPKGTSLSPTVADGLVCILPSGQAASTAGRYLIQFGSDTINVMQLGFQPGGTDNYSLIPSLMAAISPAAQTFSSQFAGGVKVVFPAVPAQLYTTYYFSNTFQLSRNAEIDCSTAPGAGINASVILLFPAGVDGVIASDGSVSPDGGQGGGAFNHCGVYAVATSSAYSGGGATSIAQINQNGEPSGTVAPVAWGVGDGILATPARAGFHAASDEPVVGHGAYASAVTNVGGIPGIVLTLGAGFQVANNFSLSQQIFFQNGSNNFGNTDSMVVGNNTFTFVTGTPTTGQIKIGADWNTTGNNLVSAITTNAVDPSVVPQWGKPTSTPNVTASRQNSGTHIYFNALTGGTGGDSTPATYTPAGTAAGTFDAFFTAGNSPLFANGDVMVIGNTTLNFKTGSLTTAGDVKVASDNNTTMNNIFAAITSSCSTQCVNPSPTPNVHSELGFVPFIGADAGQYLQLWSAAGGGTTTYTGSAGSFGSTTFNGSGTTFGGGQTKDQLTVWQLPASQKFTGVSATIGNSSITVTGGPRPLRQGDWIWSDAFTYGATVLSTSGNTFPQTASIGNAFAATTMNAVANDSGGQLWVIPAAYKKEVFSNTNNNFFNGFPNGLQESCIGFVCGGTDTANVYSGDMLGRVEQGHNTAGSTSIGEIDHASTLAAVMEGGTLGSNYYGFSANTNDNGAWSFIGNCVNQNTSMFIGGYAPAQNPYCADPNQIFPTSTSGNLPIFMGQSNGHGPPGSPDIQSGNGNQMQITGGFNFLQSNLQGNYSFCINGGGWTVANDPACGSSNAWAFGWNNEPFFGTPNAWMESRFPGQSIPGYWLVSGNTTPPFKGYSGPQGSGIAFPTGALFGSFEGLGSLPNNIRYFAMDSAVPNNRFHLAGDLQCNTSAVVGGNACWIDVPNFSTTLGANVVSGTTTSVTVGACPSPSLTGTVQIIDTSVSPNLPLGQLTSCSATTLTFTAAALNNGTSGDTIKFVQWEKFGTVQDANLPAISSCGGGTPAMTAGSNNVAGQFTMGTGTPTACTITFAHAYPNAAFCTITPASSGGAAISGGYYISAQSAAAFTLTIGTGTASLVFNYGCGGN